MAELRKLNVAPGVYWVEAPAADLRVLCGCPADSVKLLMRRGLIVPREVNGVIFETGPNAVLLSDVLVQNGALSNLAEFPVLQMLYRQGMMLPDHPGNTGRKPLLIGSQSQARRQMAYIHRGNYGLLSEDELSAAGADARTARELMRLKIKFAFGKIQDTEELLDYRVVRTTPVELRHGVTVRRLQLNVFEFRSNADSVVVDLNLAPGEVFSPAFMLGHHRLRREYFAVLHSGSADGWDAMRPAMSSVLMFQGKVYLIDAAAHTRHCLNALGISIGEVEGVFHTHAHDDHFAGLTTLMRSDRKIKYYATPLVRACVSSKLAALLGKDEEELANFFDVRDLVQDQWNEVDGMQVKPLFSPHPVETTPFVFRAACEGGYRQYAHFADLIGLELLQEWIEDDPSLPGVSRELFERVRRDYLTPVDLKKIDAGGGLIHGNAQDFRDDTSGKIVLAHAADEYFTPADKEIGSGAPFGTVDILIPAQEDHIRQKARELFACYFPGTPEHERRALLNSPVETFNPESVLLRRGRRHDCAFLVLTGAVEAIRTDVPRKVLPAGALIGDVSIISAGPCPFTYRATSFVQALRLPADVLIAFIDRNRLRDRALSLTETREFLMHTPLFGDALSYAVQNAIADAMQTERLEAGRALAPREIRDLFVVRSGRATLAIGRDVIETLGPGACWGESTVLYGFSGLFHVEMLETTDVYHVPAEMLRDIPAVRWKLVETYDRRMRAVVASETGDGQPFLWRSEYGTAVPEMDEQHKALIQAAATLQQQIEGGAPKDAVAEGVAFLVHYTETHFRDEEALMDRDGFPGLAFHRRKHEELMQSVGKLAQRLEREDAGLGPDVIMMLKHWVIGHILTEDWKYGAHRTWQ